MHGRNDVLMIGEENLNKSDYEEDKTKLLNMIDGMTMVEKKKSDGKKKQ